MRLLWLIVECLILKEVTSSGVVLWSYGRSATTTLTQGLVDLDIVRLCKLANLSHLHLQQKEVFRKVNVDMNIMKTCAKQSTPWRPVLLHVKPEHVILHDYQNRFPGISGIWNEETLVNVSHSAIAIRQLFGQLRQSSFDVVIVNRRHNLLASLISNIELLKDKTDIHSTAENISNVYEILRWMHCYLEYGVLVAKDVFRKVIVLETDFDSITENVCDVIEQIVVNLAKIRPKRNALPPFLANVKSRAKGGLFLQNNTKLHHDANISDIISRCQATPCRQCGFSPLEKTDHLKPFRTSSLASRVGLKAEEQMTSQLKGTPYEWMLNLTAKIDPNCRGGHGCVVSERTSSYFGSSRHGNIVCSL